MDPRVAVSRVAYEEIVREAGPLLGVSVLPIVAWRACSGIAHGDLWATLTLTTRTALPQTDPDVATMSIAISAESLWYMKSVAIGLTRQAWALYDQRSTAPY